VIALLLLEVMERIVVSAERSTNSFRQKRKTLAFWKADIPQNGKGIPAAW
jgi:hypothetical protein